MLILSVVWVFLVNRYFSLINAMKIMIFDKLQISLTTFDATLSFSFIIGKEFFRVYRKLLYWLLAMETVYGDDMGATIDASTYEPIKKGLLVNILLDDYLPS